MGRTKRPGRVQQSPCQGTKLNEKGPVGALIMAEIQPSGLSRRLLRYGPAQLQRLATRLLATACDKRNGGTKECHNSKLSHVFSPLLVRWTRSLQASLSHVA